MTGKTNELRLDGTRLIRFGAVQIRYVDLMACVFMIALILICILQSLTIGTTVVGWRDLWLLGAGAGVDADQAYAIWHLRLPRAITGVLAGSCIAMSGAMLQSLTRNPIADPGLLGLSQGALTAIVLSVVLLPHLSFGWLPLIGLAGGVSVAFLLAWLTRHRNAGNALAVLLLGLSVETALSSITAIIILYSPPDLSYSLASWLAGTLYMADWASLRTILVWVLLALPIVLVLGPALTLFELGEERALSLGLITPVARFAVLVIAVLLTSAAVTITGPLVFLGVMAPNIAAVLHPCSGRVRLVLAGLTGGFFVLLADVLSRLFGQDFGLPIGLSMTLIGVPVFIFSIRLRAIYRMS